MGPPTSFLRYLTPHVFPSGRDRVLPLSKDSDPRTTRVGTPRLWWTGSLGNEERGRRRLSETPESYPSVPQTSGREFRGDGPGDQFSVDLSHSPRKGLGVFTPRWTTRLDSSDEPPPSRRDTGHGHGRGQGAYPLPDPVEGPE